MELCQLDKLYVHNLMNYNKILLQRNQLLKDLNFYYDKDLCNTLDVWDMQLASYGSKLILRRTQFIDELNEIIYGIHRNLTNGKEEINIKYEPNISGNNLYDELLKTGIRILNLRPHQ